LADDPLHHKIIPFEPGDIMLVNNHITYHTRSAFEDCAEPEYKRDLLRLWLAVSNSRPLSSAYLPSFRHIAAGAIRGGVTLYSRGAA